MQDLSLQKRNPMQPLTTLYTYIATLLKKDLQLTLIYCWLARKNKICLHGRLLDLNWCKGTTNHIAKNICCIFKIGIGWPPLLSHGTIFFPLNFYSFLVQGIEASSLSWRIPQWLRKNKLPFMYTFFVHIYSCLWASRSWSTWYRYP